MTGRRGMKGESLGGSRPRAGRKSPQIGDVILDAMPMMADVISGYIRRPREQRRNESPLAWARQTHVWPRLVGLIGTRRTAQPIVICKSADTPSGPYSERVAWVRQILGYDDSLVLKCGQIFVAIQSDGVRAALTDVQSDARGST